MHAQSVVLLTPRGIENSITCSSECSAWLVQRTGPECRRGAETGSMQRLYGTVQLSACLTERVAAKAAAPLASVGTRARKT
jgi:hypothetical protein